MQVAIQRIAERDVPASWCSLKRTVDVLLGLVFFLIALPIVTIAALGILAVTGGSPFYAQERVGQNGRRFKMFKLRTMVENAHAMRDEVMHLN